MIAASTESGQRRERALGALVPAVGALTLLLLLATGYGKDDERTSLPDPHSAKAFWWADGGMPSLVHNALVWQVHDHVGVIVVRLGHLGLWLAYARVLWSCGLRRDGVSGALLLATLAVWPTVLMRFF